MDDEDWLPSIVRRRGPFTLYVSQNGYGWTLVIGRRIAWHSPRATTPMWPRIHRGADENCNRSVTVVLWPIGHLDVWWEWRWRIQECDDCKANAAG